MTQTEFIKQYCERSNIKEETLNELGTVAAPCDCGEDDCCGWAMVSRSNLIDHIKLYVKSYQPKEGQYVQSRRNDDRRNKTVAVDV